MRRLLTSSLFGLHTRAEGVYERCLGCVVLWELYIEFKFHHDSISLILHDIGEADKVLVDYERFLGLIRRHRVESLEDLSHQDVEDFIDLQ